MTTEITIVKKNVLKLMEINEVKEETEDDLNYAMEKLLESL